MALARWLLPACFAAIAAGCQQDVAPVSGRVTIDGQPLPDAVVTFQPKPDRAAGQPLATGSVGRTDREGRYSLRLIQPDKPGAAVGQHTVTISTESGGSEEAPPKGRKLPKAWTDGSQRFHVPKGGTREADFDIATDGKRAK